MFSKNVIPFGSSSPFASSETFRRMSVFLSPDILQFPFGFIIARLNYDI